jgi:hypothetical protein
MAAIASRSLSLSMRCYRGLLRAYPQAFLREFEDLMLQAFGDLAHRAVRTKGIWGLFMLWLRTLPDLISSAFGQRFRTTAEWSFRFRWIVACTAPIALAAIWIFGPSFFIFQFKLWLRMLPHHPPLAERVVMSRTPPQVIFTNPRLLLDTALMGLFFGLFQSLAPRWNRSRRAAWMIATAFGVVFAAGILLLVPFVASYLRVTIHPWRLILEHHPGLYYGGSAAMCVSIMGMLQTLVLARRNPRALVWIPASAVGVFVCSVVAVFTPALPFAGLVYGLLTVLPLEWILQPRVAQVALSADAKKLPS